MLGNLHFCLCSYGTDLRCERRGKGCSGVRWDSAAEVGRERGCAETSPLFNNLWEYGCENKGRCDILDHLDYLCRFWEPFSCLVLSLGATGASGMPLLSVVAHLLSGLWRDQSSDCVDRRRCPPFPLLSSCCGVYSGICAFLSEQPADLAFARETGKGPPLL